MELHHHRQKLRGVYVIKATANDGRPYVGRTSDLERRLTEHIRSGKLADNVEVEFHSVGQNGAREVRTITISLQ